MHNNPVVDTWKGSKFTSIFVIPQLSRHLLCLLQVAYLAQHLLKYFTDCILVNKKQINGYLLAVVIPCLHPSLKLGSDVCCLSRLQD